MVFIASFLLYIGDSGPNIIRSALNTPQSSTLVARPWYDVKWSFIVLPATIFFSVLRVTLKVFCPARINKFPESFVSKMFKKD
jgi:hypothetical protein